jgi:PAS domain S-box-containing protein
LQPKWDYDKDSMTQQTKPYSVSVSRYMWAIYVGWTGIVCLMAALLVDHTRRESETFWVGLLIGLALLWLVVLAGIVAGGNRLGRRIQEALGSERQLLRTIVDAIPHSIYAKDLAGRFTMVNARSLRGLKASTVEDVLGKTYAELVSPEVARRAQEQEELIKATGEAMSPVEEIRRDPQTGEIESVGLISKVPLRDATGAVCGVVGFNFNITERKKAEEALQRSLSLQTATLESTTDGILVVNRQGAVSGVNHKFFELWKIPGEVAASGDDARLLGFVVDQLKDPEQFLEKVRYLYAHPEELTFDLVEFKDGRIFERYSQPQRLGEGIVGRVWCFRDVSDRMRSQRELEKAKLDAEAGARAKSEFLATMSHEIRTPMNGVIGMTSLLLETPLSPDQREFAETIRNSGETLLTIINDILDFSKIESGKLELERLMFSPVSCIQETIDLLAPKASEKGLELKSMISPDFPAAVIGDSTRVRQVLLNLVGNALKFTERGEIVVTASAEEKTGDGIDVTIAVRDTGIGMSDEVKSRLFQSFSQGDSSTTRRFGGTGLGLAISRRLVELMGGRLLVESSEGAGSVFSMVLPAPLVTDVHIVAQGDNSSDTRILAEVIPVKILLVEDNPVNQTLAKRMLGKLGYVPDLAENGRVAVEIVGSGPYDLVFMDVLMPDVDGLEATRRIVSGRDLRDRPVIIAMTANAMEGDKEQCLAAGMDDYISKPVRIDDFRRMIEKYGVTRHGVRPRGS